MKAFYAVLAANLATVLALPQDAIQINSTIVQDDFEKTLFNETHAFVTIDGVKQMLDLTTPDVIRENGLIRKPLGPGSFLTNSTEPHPDFVARGIHERSTCGDGCCSQYFSCNNEYIIVRDSLWSYWRTPYGAGLPLNGRSGWWTVDGATSFITAIGSGLGFSHNTVNSGCHIRFTMRGCHINIPRGTVLGSYNCAGCN